jgi:hypothetical protein
MVKFAVSALMVKTCRLTWAIHSPVGAASQAREPLPSIKTIIQRYDVVKGTAEKSSTS